MTAKGVVRWRRRPQTPTAPRTAGDRYDGELHDPVDAYAASDIVIGMGSSALKGMASRNPWSCRGSRASGDFWTRHR